jgi:hypothetical protein
MNPEIIIKPTVLRTYEAQSSHVPCTPRGVGGATCTHTLYSVHAPAADAIAHNSSGGIPRSIETELTLRRRVLFVLRTTRNMYHCFVRSGLKANARHPTRSCLTSARVFARTK